MWVALFSRGASQCLSGIVDFEGGAVDMRNLVHAVAHCAAAALLFLASAGCGENGGTEPETPSEALFSAGPSLIQCPTSETLRSLPTLALPLVETIVSVGGTSITIPAGAVLSPTLITVTVPASKYMEISVRANDLAHFIFQQPVEVTIDYSRCTRSDIDRAPVEAWYINAVTKQMLEDMDGVDDKATRRITFRTGHLSNYAVAF